jgi:homoserine O-acetyltransferase
MDSHDVGRGRGGIDAALGSISCKVMIIGIDSDLLYPLHEQEEIANKVPGAILNILQSINGHGTVPYFIYSLTFVKSLCFKLL